MDDKMNYNEDKKHKGSGLSPAGVAALAVVTAAVLGSFLFSFGNNESTMLPVSQLLESAQDGGAVEGSVADGSNGSGSILGGEASASDGSSGSGSGSSVSGGDGSSITGGESSASDGSSSSGGEGSGLGSTGDSGQGTAEDSEASENTGERVKGPLDVSDVVAAAMPSIVSITSETVQVVEYYFYGRQEIPGENAGSGIIIGENDEELLVATNYHVVEDADSITVCFSVDAEDAQDGIVEAKLKGSDVSRDLAVVAVSRSDIPDEIREQIAVAVLGNSEELRVGEKAIAIGNALGYGQAVTAGIISAVNRTLTIDTTPQEFLQTDAAINFGNSGGALLNASGEVIGINSAKATASGVEGMGYAIPIDEAKPILEELMNRETRDKVSEEEQGSFGVEFRDVSQDARELYGIPSGAFVYEIGSDSAAARAGIAQGDIITKIDGSSVDSVSTLERLLTYYRAGETVEIVYASGSDGTYEEKTTTVTLQEPVSVQEREPYQSYQQPYDIWGGSPWSGNWW